MRSEELEMVIYAGLFHNFICRMSRLYLGGYRKTMILFGTEPKIMVALAAPDKITAVFRQYVTYLFFIFRHYAITFALRFVEKSRYTSSCSLPFNSSTSGTASLTCSMSRSSEPFSSTRGISSFCAIHTRLIIPNKRNFVFVHG